MKPKFREVLQGVELPENVKTIGRGAFDGMKSWTVQPEQVPEGLQDGPYKTGYVLGTLLQVVAVVVAAHYGSGGVLLNP